jgi:hypothetical protein
MLRGPFYQVSENLSKPKMKCFVTGKWRDDLEFLLTPGLSQAVLDILKLLAALGNTIFVKTLTEICILAKVSKIIPISN